MPRFAFADSASSGASRTPGTPPSSARRARLEGDGSAHAAATATATDAAAPALEVDAEEVDAEEVSIAVAAGDSRDLWDVIPASQKAGILGFRESG